MTLVWTLAVLAAAVALTPLMSRPLGRALGWPLAAFYLVATAVFLPAVSEVLNGKTPEFSVPWIPQLGVEFALRADGLGVVFTLIALVIGAVVFVYSTKYLEEGPQLSFYLVMATFTLAMVGLVLANDLVLLFICWELTSLASFLLIARSGVGGEAPSMRTLLITFIGGLLLLAAVALMIGKIGTGNVHEVLTSSVWRDDPAFTGLVAALVALAACTKSAQFPFHVWLPDAMAAATPVSAYLHAAAVVKAGIFLLLRFTPAFHDAYLWHAILIPAGLVTAFIGGWFALQQSDVKKLMAYSTVSQLGLIVAVIGVGTEIAIMAAVLHTIAHALFKSGLFMMVGVIDHTAHTRDLRRLPALYRYMPVSFTVTILGCASMAGLPPMLGFVSKESLLTGALDSPYGSSLGWAVALGIAAASILTFTYCAKIVLNGFVDARGGAEAAERDLHPVDPIMLGAAALPIVASLPLGILVGVLDTPVAQATRAAFAGRGEAGHGVHLALFHGITPELGLTLVIVTAGIALTLVRGRFFTWCEEHPFLFTGADVIERVHMLSGKLGRALAKPIASDDPMRHLASIVVSLTVLVAASFLTVRGSLAPLQPNLNQPIDLLVLVLISCAVFLVCSTDSRLSATVALSAVGIVVTVQILALGAPDVALTQLLVESLTVIVIMLVLQKLPLTFGKAGWRRRPIITVIAIAAGLAAGGITYMFAARRSRSDLALEYINHAHDITGGHNIVNVILVEFRAFDTMGELAVLGMAGIAIVAVLSTVRHEFLDPSPEEDRNYVPAPEIPLRPKGSPAHRAIMSAWGNAAAMQFMVRVLTPILILISLGLFLRGHNAPGGGFIAALVGSAIIGLIYLSTSEDRQIGPPRLPILLIGFGILIAIGTGLAGYLETGFLDAMHGHIGPEHVSSSMVFDVGVYLAVLGLVMMSFNLLGTSGLLERTGREEQTRERADEAFEGELPHPLRTVRGKRWQARVAKRRARVGASTSHVSDGTRPEEPGR
ncbi:DUF4040 family protein [Dermabacteraceae bacterium P13147]